jgi:hypothetical protein
VFTHEKIQNSKMVSRLPTRIHAKIPKKGEKEMSSDKVLVDRKQLLNILFQLEQIQKEIEEIKKKP